VDFSAFPSDRGPNVINQRDERRRQSKHWAKKKNKKGKLPTPFQGRSAPLGLMIDVKEFLVKSFLEEARAFDFCSFFCFSSSSAWADCSALITNSSPYRITVIIRKAVRPQPTYLLPIVLLQKLFADENRYVGYRVAATKRYFLSNIQHNHGAKRRSAIPPCDLKKKKKSIIEI
jgi:hypothetical protein